MAAAVVALGVVVVLAVLGDSSSSVSTAQWTSFEAPDGAFSVDLPGEPTRSRQTLSGTDVSVDVWATETGDSAHVVTTLDLRGQPFDLQGAAQGSAMQLGGTIVSEEDTTVLGAPAVTYVVVSQEGGGFLYARGLVTVIGQRAYILVAVGPDREVPSFDRLRDSFAVPARG